MDKLYGVKSQTEEKQEPDLFNYEQQHQQIAQGQQENVKKLKAEEAKKQQTKKNETGYEPESREETRNAHNKKMEELYGVKSKEQKDINKTLNEAEKTTQKKLQPGQGLFTQTLFPTFSLLIYVKCILSSANLKFFYSL